MLKNLPPAYAPTPRFAIGQMVMVRSAIDPARNTDCTSIVDRTWFEGTAAIGWYCGWQYVVSDHLDAWAMESSIKPRPEPGAESWRALRKTLQNQESVDSILS